ncbi:helix-turn-helix domain-containing protein [Methylopila henanensis]|uniref:Helix-turn-helix domain-containing protein n=1 Tax=Methylopila henanensis TaxID=873516 RepID=A0ABW4K8F4_9HYPH
MSDLINDDGQSIIDGLDDVIAFNNGDQNAARLIPWQAPTSVDVRAIRNKLGMSQKEFAARFGLKLASLRNWEQDKRVPETATRVLLTIIDREPDAVKKALAIG